jgi:DNA-binding transcriptional LysR family regulator
MEFPELPFLRSFVTIYETRSLTRAAADLHRTQPSVTYQLQQLERAIGRELFRRRGRRLEPTPMADRLYRLAREFGGAVREARTDGGHATRVEIASVSAFGRYVVFPALLAMEPMPNFAIRFPTADEVIRLALTGRCDVGFSYRAPHHPELVAEPVYTEAFVLVGDAAWARRLRGPGDFRDPPVVTYDEGDYLMGLWAGHHFQGRAPSWHSAAHCEELEEVLALVARGVGVAVVPDFMVNGGGVRIIAWPKLPLSNTVVVVRRSDAAADPRVDRLISALRRIPPGPGAANGRARKPVTRRTAASVTRVARRPRGAATTR